MSDRERADGTIDLSDLPPALIALGSIDTLEYEVEIDIEEAAAWRRRVFEAESAEEVQELINEFNEEMYERGIVEVGQLGEVRAPFLPTLFGEEDREE